MRIDIKQRKITLTSTYNIFVDNEERYKAQKKIFRLFAEIPITDINSGEVKLRIKKRFFFIKPHYSFYRGNDILEFINVDFWRGHYQCTDSLNVYDIYANTGLRFSIFKNDVQIAWFSKNSVAVFAGDEYVMSADHNCDVELLSAFCITIDHHLFRRNRGMVNFDFGRPGMVKRQFDESWQPK